MRRSGSDSKPPRMRTTPMQATRRVESLADDLPEILDTVREPLLILDAGLRVRHANSAFSRTFRLAPDDVRGRCLHEVGDGRWDVHALQSRIEDLLAREPLPGESELVHS